jgi:hypothetical protein
VVLEMVLDRQTKHEIRSKGFQQADSESAVRRLISSELQKGFRHNSDMQQTFLLFVKL